MKSSFVLQEHESGYYHLNEAINKLGNKGFSSKWHKILKSHKIGIVLRRDNGISMITEEQEIRRFNKVFVIFKQMLSERYIRSWIIDDETKEKIEISQYMWGDNIDVDFNSEEIVIYKNREVYRRGRFLVLRQEFNMVLNNGKIPAHLRKDELGMSLVLNVKSRTSKAQKGKDKDRATIAFKQDDKKNKYRYGDKKKMKQDYMCDYNISGPIFEDIWKEYASETLTGQKGPPKT